MWRLMPFREVDRGVLPQKLDRLHYRCGGLAGVFANGTAVAAAQPRDRELIRSSV